MGRRAWTLLPFGPEKQYAHKHTLTHTTEHTNTHCQKHTGTYCQKHTPPSTQTCPSALAHLRPSHTHANTHTHTHTHANTHTRTRTHRRPHAHAPHKHIIYPIIYSTASASLTQTRSEAH